MRLANFSFIKNIKEFMLKPERHIYEFDNVLGTVLDMQIVAQQKDADLAADLALAEIDRLAEIYNRFDKQSELNKYLSSDLSEQSLSSDLLWLFEAAQYWQKTTSGAFNPAVDAFSQLWQAAERESRLPLEEELGVLLEPISRPLYKINSGKVRKLFNKGLNFNAIAKGRIVDLAAQAAFDSGNVAELVINIGGDIRHFSQSDADSFFVGVSSVADTQKPELMLKLSNQAIATSGASERGFRFKNKWYSHVIDPKTGWPVQSLVNTTVIAPDCATADVLATAFNVLEPKQSIAIANQLQNVGCHIATKTGQKYSNEFFKAHIVPMKGYKHGNN